MRGETPSAAPPFRFCEFQSTPLMRGETNHAVRASRSFHYFNPLPSCEGRRLHCPSNWFSSHFNPLPSCEGRPGSTIGVSLRTTFQSTPLMRGETAAAVFDEAARLISIHSPHARGDWGLKRSPVVSSISIHSPHARGDAARNFTAVTRDFISIHSPHARGDCFQRRVPSWLLAFQSTPLMRGETRIIKIVHYFCIFQSTPLMRGETH